MCTEEKENASFSGSDYSFDSFDEDDDDDSFGGGGGGGIVHRKVFGGKADSRDSWGKADSHDSWGDNSLHSSPTYELEAALDELPDNLLELDEISDLLAHGTEDQMVRLSHCLFCSVMSLLSLSHSWPWLSPSLWQTLRRS